MAERWWVENHKKVAVTGAAFVGISFLSYIIAYSVFFLWIFIIGSLLTWTVFKYEVTAEKIYNLLVGTISSDYNRPTAGTADRSVKDGFTLCDICSTSECQGHNRLVGPEVFQPWIGVYIPQKVDSALEEFLNEVLNKFIYTWYREISDDDAVVDLLKHEFRFFACQLLIRVKKVDIVEFVMDDVIPTIVEHLIQHVHSHRRVGKLNAENIKLRKNLVHRSLYSREDELQYVKLMCINLYPYILSPEVRDSQPIRLLLEQIIGGLIILPVADKISDPDIVNNLLILLLDTTPPPENPDPPSDCVEILAHWTSSDSSSYKQPLFAPDLGHILSDKHSLLVVFMEYMKTHGSLRYLQFFLALEDFKKDLFALSNPSQRDLERLFSAASSLYRLFLKPDAVDFIDVGNELRLQFEKLLTCSGEKFYHFCINQDFISRTYEHLYSLIEGYFIPKFRHSRALFNHVYGPKNARRGKSIRETKTDKRFLRALSSKLKLSLKSDRSLSRSGSLSNLSDHSGCSTPDNNSLKEELMFDEPAKLIDLTNWTCDIPAISVLFDEINKKPTNNFQIKVYPPVIHTVDKIETAPKSRTVYRTYNDFYLLEQKIKQFHGDKLTTSLPAKRILFTVKDHEVMDQLRLPFELFLKGVLSNEEFRHSELLLSFLSVEDFSKSNLSEVRSIDRVFKSVPLKLAKERGQNLNSFLRMFQNSTLVKPAKPDLIAAECKRSIVPLITQHEVLEGGGQMFDMYQRNYHSCVDVCPPDFQSSLAFEMKNPLFEKSHVRQASNGVTLEPDNHLLSSLAQKSACSRIDAASNRDTVFDCVSRIVEEVYVMPKSLHCILSTVSLVGRNAINKCTKWFIQSKLNAVFEEHRLQALINLLQETLFGDDTTPRTTEQKAERRQQALADVLSLCPELISWFTDLSGIHSSTEEIVDVLQHPKLNKQLVYTLLDLVVLRLFPELSTQDTET